MNAAWKYTAGNKEPGGADERPLIEQSRWGQQAAVWEADLNLISSNKSTHSGRTMSLCSCQQPSPPFRSCFHHSSKFLLSSFHIKQAPTLSVLMFVRIYCEYKTWLPIYETKVSIQEKDRPRNSSTQLGGLFPPVRCATIAHRQLRWGQDWWVSPVYRAPWTTWWLGNRAPGKQRSAPALLHSLSEVLEATGDTAWFLHILSKNNIKGNKSKYVHVFVGMHCNVALVLGENKLEAKTITEVLHQVLPWVPRKQGHCNPARGPECLSSSAASATF